MNFIYLLFFYLVVLLWLCYHLALHFTLNYKNSITIHFIKKSQKNTKFYKDIRLIDNIYILKYNAQNKIIKAKTDGS